MLEIEDKFLDKKDQIITTEENLGDRQGDSLQRAGFFYIGAYLHYHLGLIRGIDNDINYIDLCLRLANLRKGLGVFKRGTVENVWSGSWLTMSRDQILPNIIALGLANNRFYLRKILLSHLSRLLLFTTNIYRNRPSEWYEVKLPDVTLMGTWAAYIRAFRFRPLYPLLVLFDISLLIQTAWLVYYKAQDPNFSDELTLLSCLIQSKLVYPTEASALACRLYTRRPKAGPPHLGYKSDYGPQTALDQYFSYGGGLAAPLDDLFRPVLKEFLDQP